MQTYRLTSAAQAAAIHRLSCHLAAAAVVKHHSQAVREAEQAPGEV